MTIVLVVVAIVVAPLLLRQALRWLVHRALDGVPDPALHIGPPRRYVDADGRSDFRADRCADFLNGRAR